MDYEITIGNKNAKLSITTEGGKAGSFLIKSSTESLEAVIERRDSSGIVVSIGDRMYSLRVLKRSNRQLEFLLNGEHILAQLGQKDIGTSDSGSEVATVDESVISNFPARVVKVMISRGTKIKKGDTLIVLEAMKMEAQIRSPRGCTVQEVYVAEGDTVPKGTKLARLKFD